MKELLETMMKGWKLHEQSWDGSAYTKSEIAAMIEVCEGDKLKGELLYLFSYWSNDIQAIAAFYGVGYDGPIPEAPGSEYWWDTKTKEWRRPG